MGTFVPPMGQPGPLQPGEWVSASQPSVVTFNLKQLSPPSNLYLRQEEGILLSVQNLSATVNPIRVTYRMLLTDGRVQIGYVDTTVGTVGNFQVFFIQLTEGYLLSVQAAASGAAKRGQCYLRLGIARSVAEVLLNGVTLVQGYLGFHATIGWPGGPQQLAIEGPGFMQTLTTSNPAAGTDVVFNFGLNQRFRVQSIDMQLVTSATAANRIVRARILDPSGNLVFQGAPSQVVPASTTAQVTIQSGGTITTGDPLTVGIPLPSPCILPASAQISTNTTALQAGDQFSNIFIFAETLIEP